MRVTKNNHRLAWSPMGFVITLALIALLFARLLLWEKPLLGRGEMKGGGQFYRGYKTVHCHSCDNVNELENHRAPLAFIIGTQHPGNTSLISHLLLHPRIEPYLNKDLHEFIPQWEKHATDDNANRCGIMKHYNKLLSKSRFPPQDGLLENSPEYMMESHILPQRILCAFPQAKFIVLLQNPTDRAFAQYQALAQLKAEGKGNLESRTFKDYVEQHIAQLDSLGLLSPDLTPEQEYEQWSNKPNLEHNSVARGLYAIQIRQYLSVLGDHFGWDKIWDHLLILDAEQVRKDEQAHLNKVVDFLNIPFFLPPTRKGKQHTPLPDVPMAEDARAVLDELYRPHNKKLHQLLAPFGFELNWAEAA